MKDAVGGNLSEKVAAVIEKEEGSNRVKKI